MAEQTRRSPMAWLAGHLGATEGQAWTVLVAIGLAVVSVAGMTGALEPQTVIAAAPDPVGPDPAPAPSTDGPSHPRATANPPAQPGLAPPVRVLPEPAPVPLTPPDPDPRPRPDDPGPILPDPVRVLTPIGNQPAGIAVNGNVFVATNASGSNAATVEEFDGSGAFVRRIVLDGVQAVAGLAVGGNRAFVVAVAPVPAVVSIDLDSGRVGSPVALPNLPVCVPILQAEPCEDGVIDGAPQPVDVVVATGGVLVSDAGQGVLFRVAGSQVTVWAKGFRDDPTQQGGPTGLARDGDRVLAIARTTGPTNASDRIVAIPIRDGQPGAIATVATLDDGDAPVDVVALAGGFAVTLQAAGAVAILGADGAQQDRLGGGTLESPRWIARDGDDLFVTDVGTRDVFVLTT